MEIEETQPFHILSRAVEERGIFDSATDCYRFIFQMHAANVGKPAFGLWKKDTIKAARSLLNGEDVSVRFIIKEHSPLVDIISFSLVVNHYHFFLLSNIENGIAIFTKKLNGGFAKYFNLKYGRKGALFGGRYKRVPIETEFQSDAVDRYLNIINPLDVYSPGWREKGLDSIEKAFEFLENYEFSSFPDRIGKRNSIILAPRETLEKYLLNVGTEDKEKYIAFVNDFLKEKLNQSEPFFIE